MPVEDGRSSSTSREVDVDDVYVAEDTRILSSAPEDARFVKIVGDPSHCCSVPLAGLTLLVATRPPFICLMQRHSGYWENGYCPRAVAGE